MLSILELQGREALEALADNGELPKVMSITDIVHLMLRETGDDFRAVLTRGYFTGELAGKEEEWSGEMPYGYDVFMEPMTNKQGLASYLRRLNVSLPRFWYGAEEINEHERELAVHRETEDNASIGKRRREQSRHWANESNAQRQAAAQSRYDQWRDEAKRIRDRRPHLSKADVARQIKINLGATESYETIKRQI